MKRLIFGKGEARPRGLFEKVDDRRVEDRSARFSQLLKGGLAGNGFQAGAIQGHLRVGVGDGEHA